MNPFTTFNIYPAYGLYSNVISWAAPEGSQGDVYFYRSESGVPGSWTLLNPDGPQTGASGEYMDSTPAPRLFAPVFYRGLVDQGGEPDTWLKGPAVTALDSTPRREYLLAREILRREYRFMRFHEGLPAFHYVTREKGEAAANVDLETRQVLGPSCPGSAEAGFTTLWKGGFYEPVQTVAMIMSLGDEDTKIRPNADGTDPEADVMLRLLAFPKPALNHMIIFPKSDRRYVVVDPIKPYLLRGSIPLVWEVRAQRLDRDDERHTIEVPELMPDPISS